MKQCLKLVLKTTTINEKEEYDKEAAFYCLSNLMHISWYKKTTKRLGTIDTTSNQLILTDCHNLDLYQCNGLDPTHP